MADTVCPGWVLPWCRRNLFLALVGYAMSACEAFELCSPVDFLLRAGDMARARQAAVSVVHVGGPRPWLVYDATEHPSFPAVAIVQPDGYLEVCE